MGGLKARRFLRFVVLLVGFDGLGIVGGGPIAVGHAQQGDVVGIFVADGRLRRLSWAGS